MLALPHTNSWGFVYSNQTNGIDTNAIGTSVTLAASDGAGTWTEIAAAGSVTAEIQYMHLMIGNFPASGATRTARIDLGYDPAGGTSYTALFTNWVCGAAGSVIASHGKALHFPCSIPAGSSIAVRGGKAAAGTTTARVWAHLYGKPSRPELWRKAAYSETVGTLTGSVGPGFTPGNASWGSWASLGTTTKKAFWAQLGVQIDNTTKNTEGTLVQLGIGDGTNMHLICDTHLWSNTNEQEQCPLIPNGAPWEIPAGAELWVRGNCNAAPASGYNATAVLFGG